jgi:hypothetical protein
MKKRFQFSVFSFEVKRAVISSELPMAPESKIQNSKFKIPCFPPCSPRGFALVMVLGFVVLLTVIVLAFFSNAMLQRQVADSSANNVRADLFALGAVDTIIGDLKQEIAACSTTTNITTGSITTTLYYPKAALNAVPALAGSTGTNGLENLVKRSAAGVPFYSGGPTRAASSSTTNASQNGRSYTTARWNKHLLLAKGNSTSTTDLTPTNTFTAPDWILVARDSSNPTSWNTNMCWSQTNSTTVVGRYAYAIYNEGGLLDANVAGYPSTVTSTNTAYKSASAYADLTQIGMSQTDVDALVNWRNAASYDSSSTNYVNYVANNPVGFLKTANTNMASGETDRQFASRQQLIEFFNTKLRATTNAPLQNALQYLGTFSRSLNQPSYRPDPARPKVTLSSYIMGSSTYAGGNTAYNQQDDAFNPAFRKIRVQAAFTRNDGSQAQVGDPLVKTRFPLNRLCWITCEGPSATASAAVRQSYLDQGIPQALLDAGNAANILKYFGLTWAPGPGTNGRGGSWTYTHVNNGNISTLDVLLNAREPDFFELLKASIAAGSAAKGVLGVGAGLPTSSAQYKLFEQSSVDNQIIQIGANIINQSAPDNFPRWIIFNDGSLNRTFWGVVDMPYLYGLISEYVLVRQANPSVTSSNQLLDSAVPPEPTLTDGGNAAMLQLPIIWNPHAIGTVAPGPAPSNLRISVSHNSAAAPSTPASTWRGYIRPLYGSASVSNNATIPQYSGINRGCIPTQWGLGNFTSSNETVITMPAPGTANNNTLIFSYNDNLYREPTPLMRVNIPAGSNLQLDTGHVLMNARQLDASGNATGTIYGPSGIPELNTGDRFIGFFLGQFPIRWAQTTTTANVTSTNNLSVSSVVAGYQGYGFTYSLEYDAGNGNWVPYQQKILDPTSWTPYQPPRDAIASASDSATASVLYGMALTGHSNSGNVNLCWDPRTKRWASNFDVWRTNLGFLDGGSKTIVGSVRPSYGLGSPCHSLWLGGISKDMMYTNTGSYLIDADGIVRRPMGAWVPGGATASTGLPMATVWTSSTQTGANAGPNISSRPIILHRPFRSVAELGYVFSDTPWRNLNFSTPESGFAALLDTFCINDSGDSNAMVAGKVDLNTRQPSVLSAVMAGSIRDELQSTQITASEITPIAQALVSRTTDFTTAGKGPLSNIADLVGRYSAGLSADSSYCNGTISPSYSGFSKDLALYSGGATSANNLVQRLRESAMRALSDTGQAGIWNLMVDLVAQAGRYSGSAGNPDQFVVEGEKRYWVHLAIDRETGKVIDQQLEPVNE